MFLFSLQLIYCSFYMGQCSAGLYSSSLCWRETGRLLLFPCLPERVCVRGCAHTFERSYVHASSGVPGQVNFVTAFQADSHRDIYPFIVTG